MSKRGRARVAVVGALYGSPMGTMLRAECPCGFAQDVSQGVGFMRIMVELAPCMSCHEVVPLEWEVESYDKLDPPTGAAWRCIHCDGAVIPYFERQSAAEDSVLCPVCETDRLRLVPVGSWD